MLSTLNFLRIFVLACAVAAASCKLNENPNSNTVDAPKSLEFWGSINEKSYYGETISKQDWYQARKHCNDSGMELASVESDSEYRFLTDIRSNGSFNAVYWTAGRDVQTLRQFVWDNSNRTLDSGAIPGDHYVASEFSTCVVLSKFNKEIWFEARSCDQYTPYALCQQVV